MKQFFSVPVPISNMKRRNLFSPLLLLAGLFVVLLMTSCSKDGAAGPEGPAGPKGESGVGSSEVIYSEWLDVAYKPDTIHLVNGKIDTIGYFAAIEVPKLTKALLSTADVKVYLNSSDASDPTVYSLPYNSSSGIYIQAYAYVNTIELYSNVDVGTVFSNGKKYQQYRYMIIPGNTQANAAAAPVDWSDYVDVKAHLKLND